MQCSSTRSRCSLQLCHTSWLFIMYKEIVKTRRSEHSHLHTPAMPPYAFTITGHKSHARRSAHRELRTPFNHEVHSTRYTFIALTHLDEIGLHGVEPIIMIGLRRRRFSIGCAVVL